MAKKKGSDGLIGFLAVFVFFGFIGSIQKMSTFQAVLVIILVLCVAGGWIWLKANQSGTLEPPTHRVKSFSGEESYNVNADRSTCTCPDWIKRRIGFAPDDPRRLCKHLTAIYASGEAEVPQPLAKYADYITDKGQQGFGIPTTARITHITAAGCTYLVEDCPEKDWLSLYSEGDFFYRYGFNKQERRWAYNEKPPEAKTVEIFLPKG